MGQKSRAPLCGKSVVAAVSRCACRVLISNPSVYESPSAGNIQRIDNHQPIHSAKRSHHLGVEVIAIFKLIKGVLLFAAAMGILNLINTDVGARLEHWITVFRMDPDSQHIHGLLAKAAHLDHQHLKAVSAGSFIYSALLFTEGIGLWFEWRWAEYLTVIATSSFVPLEIYELVKGVSVVKLLVLAINLAIVFYLATVLRRDHKSK